MTTEIPRRKFLEMILGASTVAGCAVPAEHPAAAAEKTISDQDRMVLVHKQLLLTDMLIERRAGKKPVDPHAFRKADTVLEEMRALGPLHREDTPVFDAYRLQQLASTAHIAINEGAGSLVVKIARTFPELLDGTVEMPQDKQYSLASDLSKNYGKTMAPDEKREQVEEHLEAILTRYHARFDDGMQEALQHSRKWTPREELPESQPVSKNGMTRL